MKETKTNWWMIIGIVIVVAVLTSLLTVNFTGNAIFSRSETYVTYQGVLTMLDKKCQIWSVAVPSATREVTGDDICKERNAGTCILMINYDQFSSQGMIQKCTPYVTGRSDTTTAYCCRP